MLKGLGAQAADCYRRAAESRELADCALNPSDREFHLQQETAWLALARRFQLSETIGDMLNRVTVICGNSIEVIAKNLVEGHIDIACLMDPPSGCGEILAEWQEDLVWVRSRDFVLSPGAPIPLVCWPGNPEDQPSIKALERARLPYRVTFTSPDYYARMAAVSAGIGIKATSRRHVEKSLVIAKEPYLPQLSPVRAVICLRPGLSFAKVDEIATLLRMLAPVEMQLNGN
jgi:DNA-binding transcriptional LysR family regulator